MKRWIETSMMLGTMIAITTGRGFAQDNSGYFDERSPLRISLFYGNAFQGFSGDGPKSHLGVGLGADFGKVFGGSLELGARLRGDESDGGGYGDGYEGGYGYGDGDDQCQSCPFQLSLNGNYYFLNHWASLRSAKVEPFLTGGYTFSSAGTSGSSASLVNFGGGVNWWFSPVAALRVEFREHTRINETSRYIPEVRVGITVTDLWGY